MSDLVLVEASQGGDRAAFGSLVDRYYKSIYRFAYQYMGSHHDADEVCQETFLHAFRDIKELRDGIRFKGWIFMIASNLLRRRVKRLKRERKLDIRSLNNGHVESAGNESMEPFQKLSAEEKATIIRKQLQEMPTHLRSVVIMVLMEGLAQKEAATVLNCSEASVSRYLDTARKWLAVKLKRLV